MNKNYVSLILILSITFLSSFVAGLVTQLNIDPWYQSLNKLSFSPPNWIFGTVWTVLYALMSIAIWIVYEKSKKKRSNFFKENFKILFFSSWSKFILEFYIFLLSFDIFSIYQHFSFNNSNYIFNEFIFPAI